MDYIAIIAVLLSIWAMHRENAKEMKDFHGRLCALEEKYIQMMKAHYEKIEAILEGKKEK